jgi:hypothetical protein
VTITTTARARRRRLKRLEPVSAHSATATTVSHLLAICWQPASQRGPGILFVLVGVAAYNTNLTPLVTGPVIELSERHAKIRSSR